MTLDDAMPRQNRDRSGVPSSEPADGDPCVRDTGYTPARHIHAACERRRADHTPQAPAVPAACLDPSDPPIRQAVDDACLLMAGEAEADKPLLIQQSHRLLQQRHPPPVVFDQVVVGGEA